MTAALERHDVRVLHRTLVARLLGTNGAGVFGLFAPVLLAIGLGKITNGTWGTGLGCLLVGALACWVLYRNWTAGVTLQQESVTIRGTFRTTVVPWHSLKAVELSEVSAGRGSWPGPVLLDTTGARFGCTPFVWL